MANLSDAYSDRSPNPFEEGKEYVRQEQSKLLKSVGPGELAAQLDAAFTRLTIENKSLRDALRELAFAANNATPLVESVPQMEAVHRLEQAINAAEKLL